MCDNIDQVLFNQKLSLSKQATPFNEMTQVVLSNLDVTKLSSRLVCTKNILDCFSNEMMAFVRGRGNLADHEVNVVCGKVVAFLKTDMPRLLMNLDVSTPAEAQARLLVYCETHLERFLWLYLNENREKLDIVINVYPGSGCEAIMKEQSHLFNAYAKMIQRNTAINTKSHIVNVNARFFKKPMKEAAKQDMKKLTVNIIASDDANAANDAMLNFGGGMNVVYERITEIDLACFYEGSAEVQKNFIDSMANEILKNFLKV